MNKRLRDAWRKERKANKQIDKTEVILQTEKGQGHNSEWELTGTRGHYLDPQIKMILSSD